MGKIQAKPLDISKINDGNEYGVSDQVTLDSFNALLSAAAFSAGTFSKDGASTNIDHTLTCGEIKDYYAGNIQSAKITIPADFEFGDWSDLQFKSGDSGLEISIDNQNSRTLEIYRYSIKFENNTKVTLAPNERLDLMFDARQEIITCVLIGG